MDMDQISDQHLAMFIEGHVSAEENDKILDAINSGKDIETITLVYSSLTKLDEDSDEDDDMPDVTELGKTTRMRHFERLPMAGFLGDASTGQTLDTGDETR